MEVSNEIKEDIRKTQSDLKNAIRIHQVCYFEYIFKLLHIQLNCLKIINENIKILQVWVARLQDNENVSNHLNYAEKRKFCFYVYYYYYF